jgi:hypothetical protein
MEVFMKWENMKNLVLGSGLTETKYSEIFPKACPVCSMKFRNLNDFFKKTDDISSTVLEADSGKPVKIKINCSCRGCKHVFNFELDERRDSSGRGYYIRNKFKDVLDIMVDEGMSRAEAKKEMLRLFDELYSISNTSYKQNQ